MRKFLLYIGIMLQSVVLAFGQNTTLTSSNALDFDGTNDYIQTSSMLPLTTSYTLMAWICPQSNSSLTIGGWGYTAYDHGFNCTSFLRLQNGKLKTVQNNQSIIGTTSLTLNTWYHVALTRNGDDFKIYLNGVLDGSGTQPANTYVDVFNVGLMKYQGVDYFPFQGKMDEFAVWNTALDASSISSYMTNGMTGSESGLVLYYDFNQGVAYGTNTSINSISDRTTNGYGGNLVNFAMNGATSNIAEWTLEQTITFGALADKVYGNEDFDPAATASSALEVSYSSSNENVATIVNGKVHIVGAGECTIYADQAGDNIYAVATRQSQLLSVAKATLTATAEDKTKKTGEANPTFTVKLTGFVLDDNENDITDFPQAACLADKNSPVGNYPITVSGGSDVNYNFNYVNGNLTIDQATGIATTEITTGKVWPNPTSGALFISNLLVGKEYKIYTQTGSLIMNGLSAESKIDLTKLKTGLYLVWIDGTIYRVSKK